MERLRFALLCDLSRLERWHARCLRELEGTAQLVYVLDAARKSERTGTPRGLRWYARRVAKRSIAPTDDRPSLQVTDLLGGEPVDFVLSLGGAAFPPGLAEAARLGVWYFTHETGDLPFFAEVYSGADVTRTALVAIRGGQGASVLEEGVFRTETRSYAASRNRIEEAIAEWPARACRRLPATLALPGRAATTAREPPARAAGTLALLGAKLAARRVALAWARLFRHPQWNVGVLRRPVHTLLDAPTYADEEVEWFPLEGRSGFLADPFALEHENGLHVLCEYFDYGASVGRIRALEYRDAGFSTQMVDALSFPVHVSYPYVVDAGDGVGIVPETAAAGEVALYRTREFPERWEKAQTLLPDFPGVDPTLFRHEGRWWLMCTRQGPQEDAELWVWHAPGVTGPWTPHELNPVKTDVRGARPGGRPFHHDGSLYRPAQDCSGAYGGRITLQRVTRLTPDEFVEEPAAVVEAARSSRYPIGPHTVAAAGGVVLVDGRRTVFVPAAFRAFLEIWLRAIVRRR